MAPPEPDVDPPPAQADHQRTPRWDRRRSWHSWPVRHVHRQRARRSAAVNESRTIQVIVQVQIGCRYYCDGTVQTQAAFQQADTTQVAGADVAVNVSLVEQFVWQLQLGCIAFCSGTSQEQSVVQLATTTQTASGETAANTSSTLQRIVQRQEGCREACTDVVQIQAGEQRAQALQAATAIGTSRRQPVHSEFDLWLRALSANTGVTIQVVHQVQWASCLHRCSATAQQQTALQQAATIQQAVVAASRPA